MDGRQSIIGLVSVLALCAPLACGGGAAATTSGIAPDRQLGSLDDGERAALCDWSNGLLGGYDNTITCGVGLTRRSDNTQQACTMRLLASFMTCPLSVRDYETCAKAIAAQVCELNPGGGSPECVAYETCIGS